jgi:Flp pilus assembly protein TadG
MSTLRRFLTRDAHGQAIVLVALVFMVLLFAVGLAVDAGQLYSAKRTQQEAADSAAFAGAVVLYQGGTAAQARAAAITDATRNGFTDGVNQTSVTVNYPPTSGIYSCTVNPSNCTKYVEVTIIKQVITSLVPAEAAFNPVRARGVAGAEPTNSGWALMAVDPNCDQNAIYVGSNTILGVHNGSIMDDSCHGARAANNSGGTVNMDAGFETDVVGGVEGTWPYVTPHGLEPDPFAGTARPSVVDALGNPLPSYSPQCAPSVNLPGIYTGSFSNNCTYVFAPGVYIFKGGSINWTGNAGGCTGSLCSPATADGGVFFFFSTSTYPNSGGSCPTNPVKIAGGSQTTLAPISDPTSPYRGMLIWIDSACGTSSSALLGGNGAINTTGSIYVPKGIVNLGGNGSTNVSQVVANQLNISGNGGVTVTYDRAVTFQGFYPSLVE